MIILGTDSDGPGMACILVGLGVFVLVATFVVIFGPDDSGEGPPGSGGSSGGDHLDLVDDMVLHDMVNDPGDPDVLG